MRNLTSPSLAVALALFASPAGPVAAQTPGPPAPFIRQALPGLQPESWPPGLVAGARQAALDYIEGWYEGDAARVERVLHPELVRRIAAVTVAGDDFFWHESRADFLARARRGGDNATPAGERAIRVAVQGVTRTMATVRVDSAYYVEYLSLVNLRDRWLVVNVLWENVPNDKTEVAVDPARLAELAGAYRHAGGTVFQVVVDGPRIFLQPPGDPRIEVFAEAEDRFFTKGYKSGVSFVRDGSGAVVRMVKHVNYRDIPFERLPAAPSPATTPR